MSLTLPLPLFTFPSHRPPRALARLRLRAELRGPGGCGSLPIPGTQGLIAALLSGCCSLCCFTSSACFLTSAPGTPPACQTWLFLLHWHHGSLCPSLLCCVPPPLLLVWGGGCGSFPVLVQWPCLTVFGQVTDVRITWKDKLQYKKIPFSDVCGKCVRPCLPSSAFLFPVLLICYY